MDAPRPVALFVTCIVDQVMPEVGLAAVRLLRRAGCRVTFPSQQTCCGQPFFNSGFRQEAASLAMRSIEIFEKEDAVVLPSGSCTAMIRSEYPHLLAGDPGWAERARRLAAKTFELSEFLVHETGWRPRPSPEASSDDPPLTSEPGRKTGLAPNEPQTVTYHDSCHMCRHLKLREEPRRLLIQAGCSLREMQEADRCCGFGGLFSVRLPEVSTAMTAEKLRLASNSGAGVVVTADPGCLMQMRQLAGGETPEIAHLAVVLEERTR